MYAIRYSNLSNNLCVFFKIQQEIYDIEKSIQMIKKAISDKSNPLKVAYTRLEFRTRRRDVELCRDGVQNG